jgi:hypothetical protein
MRQVHAAGERLFVDYASVVLPFGGVLFNLGASWS